MYRLPFDLSWSQSNSSDLVGLPVTSKVGLHYLRPLNKIRTSPYSSSRYRESKPTPYRPLVTVTYSMRKFFEDKIWSILYSSGLRPSVLVIVLEVLLPTCVENGNGKKSLLRTDVPFGRPQIGPLRRGFVYIDTQTTFNGVVVDSTTLKFTGAR